MVFFLCLAWMRTFNQIILSHLLFLWPMIITKKKNKQQKITDLFKAKSVKQESNQILYLKVCILTTTTTTITTTTTTTTTTTVYFKITIWLFVNLYALKIEQCLIYFWSMYFLFWLGIFNLICLYFLLITDSKIFYFHLLLNFLYYCPREYIAFIWCHVITNQPITFCFRNSYITMYVVYDVIWNGY